jgi:plasmid maintenance system killer protein
MINRSHNINDLRIPPANRLEKLKGERTGQYSILDMSPQFWFGLQMDFELDVAEDASEEKIKREIRPMAGSEFHAPAQV